MADTRTRFEKVAAMAAQDASPRERDIAAAKLLEMGAGDRQPPRRPPVAAAYPFGPIPWPGSTNAAAGPSTTVNLSFENTAGAVWVRYEL